jgi:hypothetical protein
MTFYFGLNINRNLTDIDNPVEALRNINLNIEDLDRIRGLTDPRGVTRSDFKCLSGLNIDLEKTLRSLSSDTSTYDVLSANFYDQYAVVDNDITVNGQFGATAIKYKYLDDTNTVRTADISTSRVSSWSSFDDPITSSSPIFYGAQLDLEGSLELSTLVVNAEAVPRKGFTAEIPTHRIEIDIDGEKIYLLAMKGIPLSFRGFFQNLSNSFISVSPIAGVLPSWVIKNVSDSQEYVYRERVTSSTSPITFRDTAAKERDINFYYPVNNITIVNLPAIRMVELPNVVLPVLTSVNIADNDFREFPDFSEFSSLRSISIQGNNLTRSNDPTLKLFNSNIVSRLPSTLTTLNIGNCFAGEATADLSSFDLINLNINAGSSRFRRFLSGNSLAVNSDTIETYDIAWNRFSTLDSSVQDATLLRSINLSYNGLGGTDITLASDELESFSSVDNDHNFVDVAGKQKLISYDYSYGNIPTVDKTIVNSFDNCTALQTIDLYACNVEGNFPTLTGCNSLNRIDLRYTNITDAIDADGGNPPYVLGQSSLDDCRETLSSIFIRSSQFKSDGEFHPECFNLMPVMSYIDITSNFQGITGNLPLFDTAPNLTYVLLYNNNLTGLLPNFTNNEKIFFLNFSNNNFSGQVPNVPHASLRHLILTSNQIDTFNSLDSRGLLRLHLGYNSITRIPDLSSLTSLQELLINNQDLGVVGQMFYTSGSLIGLRSLRNINLSNNSINQGNVDQIIIDLSANYDANPRRDVVVNLSGNAIPSDDEVVNEAFFKLQSAGWRIIV